MRYTHVEGVIKKQSKFAFVAIATIYAVAMTMSFAFGADAARPEPKPKEEKVDVCHVTGNGSVQLISVSEKALPAHEAHGDLNEEDCYDFVHEVSVEVSPEDGSVVELGLDEGFVWTVDASH
ncbi:MAG: hypothetical protein R3313_03055, partial [Candidatus Saccharimonadales bacterium]|nr:hypothetical protein [Candidatus Saccharimonadales bacterium]